MSQLIRQKKITDFNLIRTASIRLVYGAMIAFYVAYLVEEPFKYQIAYIAIFVAISLLSDYFAANSKASAEVSIKDNQFKLMDVEIDIAMLDEILYSQTKRFEHTIRFRFSNDTYRDFELSSPDLIEDLRFYHFLVENKLPVKMLDNDDRLI
ncbi:hypothetical protein CW745_15425 [Psychromonas sp. psych-6C06]|uniref:hypothetical protein n=1 Tax=Psychromonas sp. psych-6C06 TaxID=2058089 RepID=UPI000C336A7C|nr:hypothetical protein [Psychromonas sp. psych-6C06]PKF60334.1 hypothetical protein CW745_15425 [Psychromonas sp. psych-6C06]